MKSLWNCGSITCIMCFTWLVSHLSINSSRANSLSGPRSDTDKYLHTSSREPNTLANVSFL
uniref:Agouti signaling protein n=1 Tax=Sparus aurata TaxID=8175 RepID=A0A671TPG1_SPAAU